MTAITVRKYHLSNPRDALRKEDLDAESLCPP
jgi:hypothetical protein